MHLVDEAASLEADFTGGEWTPTAAEKEAAASLAALPELTPLTIRAALDPCRLTRSRVVMLYERIATVLTLPPIHEEAAGREQLVAIGRHVAAKIAES